MEIKREKRKMKEISIHKRREQKEENRESGVGLKPSQMWLAKS